MKRREFVRQAGSLGLIAASSRWQQLLAARIEPGYIRGHVVCGTRPLRGVRVSDGYRVVETDEAGGFSLRVGPESGPFLFVTTPTGYWTDLFYIPVATAIEQAPVFRLKSAPEREQYTAVYVTDVHVGEGHAEQSYVRLQATIDEINRLDPLPAICWVGGDITLQGGKGARYVELMQGLKMPVRNAVGNHEMLVHEPDPRDRFGQLFGPTYYSFDIGQVHYVTLDGCQVRPEAMGYKNVEGLLSERELHWLKEDLRHVPDGMAKVVSIHIPLVSDYPARRGITAQTVPWWVVRNADEVIDVLARHGVTLVLQGHLHENQRSLQRGIEFVESISVCGRWWKTPEGHREHGVSGEPRGYRILEVEGATVRHRYASSAEASVAAAGEIVGTPRTLAAHKDAALDINVFDAAHGAVVEAQFDDAAPERLVPGTHLRYHEDLEPAHHWTWTIPARALVPGQHRLRVQVRNPTGQIEFFEQLVQV